MTKGAKGATYPAALLAFALAAPACRATLAPPAQPLAATEEASFRAQPPAPAGMPSFLEGEELAHIDEARLPNGLTVWVVNRPMLPVVALSLAVRAPASGDEAISPELMSLTARAVLEGDTIWSTGERVRPPLINGSHVRVSSSPRGIALSHVVLSGGVGSAVEVIARTARAPAFAQNRFDDARLAEIVGAQNQYNQISYQLLDLGLTAQFGPEASQRYGGRPDVVRKLDREAVVRCHRRLFRPDRAILIAVGDVTLAEVMKQATAKLGDWATPSEGSVPAAPSSARTPLESRVHGRRVDLILSNRSLPQSPILVLQAGPDRSAQADDLPFELLASIIGSGATSSRANVVLRHQMGATYGVDHSVEHVGDRAVMTLGGSFDKDRLEPSIRGLLDVLADTRAHPVTEDELAHAKLEVAARLIRVQESNELQAGFLTKCFWRGLDRDRLVTNLERLQRVTVEDVRRVAERYLDPVNVEIVVVGQRDVAKALAQVGEGEVYRLRTPERTDNKADDRDDKK